MENNIINPKLASGFRDYLPQEMIIRDKIIDKIRKTFELFGFFTIDTPALEREEVLTGGDPGFKKQIFTAHLKGGLEENERLALRFDLTVPLARFIALHWNSIEWPFRRYQIGKVWRGERPQAGRFREFIQGDIDILGSSSMLADSEIIAVMYETMLTLGVNSFVIRLNNRKILNGLPFYAGFKADKNPEILRILDKLNKQNWEAAADELIRTVGLNKEQVKLIKNFIDIKGDADFVLKKAEEFVGKSLQASEGIIELRLIKDNLKILGIPADNWNIDLSLARGLSYYTGPIFETILTDLPSIGSIFGGGRYDDLINRFIRFSVPAVGSSIGLDRLFAALKELNLLPAEKNVALAMVLNFENDAEAECLNLATELRKSGIPTEIYFGKETTLAGQLTCAVKKEIPFVLIVGAEELKRSAVKIKDIKNKKQIEVKRNKIVKTLKKLIF